MQAQQALQCFGLGCPQNHFNNATGQSGLAPVASTNDEDDSVGLNKAISFVLSSHAGNTGPNSLIPPSTSLNGVVYIPQQPARADIYSVLTVNDCTSYPAAFGYGSSVKIDFSRAKFRAMENNAACPTIAANTYNPGSNQYPNCMIQVTTDNSVQPAGQVTKDTQRAWLTGINANGAAPVVATAGPPPTYVAGSPRFQCVLSVMAPNVTINNGIIRNALGNLAAGYPSADIVLLGGDNFRMHDMKIGNYNDDQQYYLPNNTSTDYRT